MRRHAPPQAGMMQTAGLFMLVAVETLVVAGLWAPFFWRYAPLLCVAVCVSALVGAVLAGAAGATHSASNPLAAVTGLLLFAAAGAVQIGLTIWKGKEGFDLGAPAAFAALHAPLYLSGALTWAATQAGAES